MNQTITLPRSAVEQALKALEMMGTPCPSVFLPGEIQSWQNANEALRAALEQPQVEQEPVAWIERWYGSGPERGWWIVCGRDHIAHLGPAEMSGEAASKIVSAHNTSPPAQRQPLTDEQIEAIDGEILKQGHSESHTGMLAFARAIERTHGIGGEE